MSLCINLLVKHQTAKIEKETLYCKLWIVKELHRYSAVQNYSSQHSIITNTTLFFLFDCVDLYGFNSYSFYFNSFGLLICVFV